MDPVTKQPRNPNDLLIFQNTDNEDFQWEFDTIRTPLPYFIAAGQTRKLPFYIARHGVEKLIDKILQKKGENHMNPLLRKRERDQIVLGLEQINQMREKTPNELALEAMKRKKDADPYEELFKEREITEQQRAEATLRAAQPAAPLYNTQYTQPNAPTPAPAQTATPGAVPAPAQEIATQQALDAADPERLNIYNFLTHRAHLDLTHLPTRQKLDAMTVDQIRVEFGPEYPEIIDPTRALVPDSKASLEEEGMPISPAGRPVVPTVPPQPVAQPVVAQPAPAPVIPPAPVANTMPSAPVTPAPVIQPTAVIPTAPIIPVAPIRPQISMNPQAPAAPLLDQQLQQVR